MKPSTPSIARSRGWRWLAYLVSMAALAWVVWLWWEHWPRVLERVSAANGWALAGGLLLASASGYANFVAFALLVRRMIGRSLTAAEMSHLYFVAQLLKHLPGRVWGIGYQAALGRREGAASSWVVVNLVHMAAASYVALALAAFVITWQHAPGAALALAAAAVAGYGLALPVLARLGPVLAADSGWRARASRFLALFTLDLGSWAAVFAVFLAAGLLHYGSWVMYAGVIGLGSLDQALALCALYMLAWFAGYVAFLTPSGIGVRELVFVALASGHAPEVVALMAVFGRASFLAVDVLLSLPFLFRGPKR